MPACPGRCSASSCWAPRPLHRPRHPAWPVQPSGQPGMRRPPAGSPGVPGAPQPGDRAALGDGPVEGALDAWRARRGHRLAGRGRVGRRRAGSGLDHELHHELEYLARVFWPPRRGHSVRPRAGQARAGAAPRPRHRPHTLRPRIGSPSQAGELTSRREGRESSWGSILDHRTRRSYALAERLVSPSARHPSSRPRDRRLPRPPADRWDPRHVLPGGRHLVDVAESRGRRAFSGGGGGVLPCAPCLGAPGTLRPARVVARSVAP